MTSAFDPYYEWLGIPPREQPPTAYRLLGIETFEANPHIIQNAAERQTTYVRSRQLGRQQEAAQRLLNEISTARVLLLDPRRKSEYDAELAARQPMIVALPPIPPAVPTSASKAEPPRIDPLRPAPALGQPLWWGIVAAGALFLLGGAYLVWYSRAGTPGDLAAKPDPSSGPATPLPEVEVASAVERQRPTKRPLKPRKRKGDPVDPVPVSAESNPTPAIPMDPAKPDPAAASPGGESLTGLADSLLDKLLKPAGEAPDPEPPADPAPKPGKPPKAKPPRDAHPRMTYRAEPTPTGYQVTIEGTPFGVATVLLDGDFGPGTMHTLTKRAPIPDEPDPEKQPLIEVEIADGKVTRVEWDGRPVREVTAGLMPCVARRHRGYGAPSWSRRLAARRRRRWS